MKNIRRQADWKRHVFSIDQKLTTHAFPLLDVFRSQFSVILEELETTITENSASEALTPLQKAVTHALQLYRVQDTLKLLANYDLSQGFNEVILTGIQKSWKSLSVTHLLKNFAQSEAEQEALNEYQNTLEYNLCEVLECERNTLFQKKQVAQLINSLAPQSRALSFFFDERLKGLFSPHYYTYLILRNRYFQKKIEQLLSHPSIETWLITQLQKILSFPKPMPIKEQLDLLDFREMEQLLKEMSSRFSNVLQAQSAPPVFQKPASPLSEDVFGLLCRYYVAPLNLLKNSLQWQRESSSPHFLSKSEDYTSTVAQEFEYFFETKDCYELLTPFLHSLLEETSAENQHTMRYEEVLNSRKEGGAWIETDAKRRKKEWSFMLKFVLPFSIKFLTEDQKATTVKAKTPFVIQWGLCFFDEDSLWHERANNQNKGFFKILIQGHTLNRHSSVIHVGDSSFYVLTTAQSFMCKKLVQLCLIALHQNFEASLPETLKQYLVKHLLPKQG